MLSVSYRERALVFETVLVSILPDSVPCAKVDCLFFLFDVSEPKQGNFGKTGVGAAGAGLGVVVVVVVVVVMVTPSMTQKKILITFSKNMSSFSNPFLNELSFSKRGSFSKCVVIFKM